ncbi:MAG: hypothetical protein ABGW56_05390 [Flavobacteriaceae bacterium]
MFYPAINFDLKSFRFLTSDYGRQIRKKKDSEQFPLADYKLYIINNKEAFQTLERQVVGLANYLYDLSRPLKVLSRYSYYRTDTSKDPWRWQKHRNQTEEEENYPSLKDYLINKLEELDRFLESDQYSDAIAQSNLNASKYNHDSMQTRKIVWKYMDWVSNSYLPTNFIGSNRVWLKSFILYFKVEYTEWKYDWSESRKNNSLTKTYEKLDLIFKNALKYYRDNHYAIKLRKQDNFDIELATERSEDAIKLLRLMRELWDNADIDTAELNELLFEMGMDDQLPIWNPMVCQKCDGEGFTVHRSKKRRCLKCKGYGYNNTHRIYPIRYQGSYSQRELSELNRDSFSPFTYISNAFGRNSRLEIPQIDEMRTLLNIAESINSREA